MDTPRTLVSIVFLTIVGCGRSPEQPVRFGASPGTSGSQISTDLAAARNGFVTKLNRRGPAPQAYESSVPPEGVQEVEYQSGELSLKAWLSVDPGDSVAHPAVVFLHGGWSFSPVDWVDASPFIEDGYVLMMPMLRAENGNPGIYEGFFREVNDAIAAGKFVAQLPYVDSRRVFVAGHSAGAMLTVLAAMMPSEYKAAAALDGYYDMQTWSAYEHPSRVVYDASDPEEVRLRNPMEFTASLRVPLILYTQPGDVVDISRQLASRAARSGKSCEVVVVQGDHHTMVEPAVKLAAQWFRLQVSTDETVRNGKVDSQQAHPEQK